MGACTPAPPPLLQACKASLKLTLQPCMSVSWRQERCPGCHPQNPNPPWHPLELWVVKCSSQGWLSPNLSLAQALLRLWKAAIRSQCFPESSSNRMHIGKEKKKKKSLSNPRHVLAMTPRIAVLAQGMATSQQDRSVRLRCRWLRAGKS